MPHNHAEKQLVRSIKYLLQAMNDGPTIRTIIKSNGSHKSNKKKGNGTSEKANRDYSMPPREPKRPRGLPF